MSQVVPAISNNGFPLQAMQTGTTKATAAASTGTSGSSSAAGTTDLGSTFLNLLSTELQNQDPTAPVDSTAMVGQMISLNQLDQLISINQAVSGASSSASSASAANMKAAAQPQLTANDSSNAAAQVVPQTALPFDPNTLMPLNSTNLTTNSGNAGGN
jgi:flagellar basal-body rod modification protein FlgD